MKSCTQNNVTMVLFSKGSGFKIQVYTNAFFIDSFAVRCSQTFSSPKTILGKEKKKLKKLTSRKFVSFTTPRRGSTDSVLSWYAGCTSNTPLDNNWGIRPGSGSRQARDLPLTLVIVRPIKKIKKGLVTKKKNLSLADRKNSHLPTFDKSTQRVVSIILFSSHFPRFPTVESNTEGLSFLSLTS